MAEPVIELDLSRPWSPEEVARTRRPPFVGALLLIIVVAAVLTGPALAAGRPFTFAWRAPAVGGHFWITDRSVFTIDALTDPAPAADEARPLALTARDPKTGALQWMVELTGPLAASYARDSHLRLSPFPPTFELGVTTSVMDTRSGLTVRAYPTSSAPLAYVADDIALLIDRDPAGGPEPSEPRFTLDTGLTRAHVVEARDLRTGAVRWTRRLAAGVLWHLPGVLPGSEGIVGLPPGQNWMLTYTGAGRMETWDLRTGTTLAYQVLGQLSEQSYLMALPDAVLVRIRNREGAYFAAYHPETLRRLWRSSPPDIYATPFGCGPLLCLQSDGALVGVDTRGGVFAWILDAPRLRPALPTAPALVSTFGEQLALFDPATGRRVSGDGSWRVVDAAPYRSQVVLARPQGAGGAILGVLDLSTNRTRRLGTVSPFPPASQCAATDVLVACEVDGVVRVWYPR